MLATNAEPSYRRAENSCNANRTLSVIRWLDLILLIASAPFVVLLGLPIIGYIVGVVTWALQRTVAEVIARRAQRAQGIREYMGLTLGSTLARGWLVALGVLAIGLNAGRQNGLAAGVSILAAFTVYFALSIIVRGPAKIGAA